jgi:hypothetical protein
VTDAIAGIVYTCPMHPEVRQNHPGACPKCGMALEPLMPTLDEAENSELLDFRRRFAWTLPLTLLGQILELKARSQTSAAIAHGRPGGRLFRLQRRQYRGPDPGGSPRPCRSWSPPATPPLRECCFATPPRLPRPTLAWRWEPAPMWRRSFPMHCACVYGNVQTQPSTCV